MVVEARETILGIPYKRETLASGTVEPLKVWEGDIAEDYISDFVERDALVVDPDNVSSRRRNFMKEVVEIKPLRAEAINRANLGRRRFVVHRRTIHWRP